MVTRSGALRGAMRPSVPAVGLLLLLAWAGAGARGCTTFIAGRLATADGSVISVQSNDGAGDRVGNYVKRAAADHAAGEIRKPGVPQVAHTYAYYSTGYAVMNEHQVGMSEGTTSAVYTARGGAAGGGALLNIVDLEEIALERSQSAVEAIRVMGSLAEAYGFYGAADTSGSGESVLVSDAAEAWVFHVLPDSTGTSAIWAAQRIPDDHVAVVTNTFIIREVDVDSDVDMHDIRTAAHAATTAPSTSSFLYSANIKAEATKRGWTSGPIDFAGLFSAGEVGHKYASGRRTWRVYTLLGVDGGGGGEALSPYYDDLIASRPYPVSARPGRKVEIRDFFNVMRDHYDRTEFDLSVGLAAGPFGAPARWSGAPANVTGWWERSIAYHGTIITTVVQSRGWLDNAVGGVVYAAPHSADTACFTPFAVGVATLPDSFTNASGTLARTHAWWAFLLVYNAVQVKYVYMIPKVRALQAELEDASLAVVDNATAAYLRTRDTAAMTAAYAKHADAVVAAFAALSDELVQTFPDGYCNGCGLAHTVPYPAWWLEAVGYTTPRDPPQARGSRHRDAHGAGGAACVAACDDSSLIVYKRCVSGCLGT